MSGESYRIYGHFNSFFLHLFFLQIKIVAIFALQLEHSWELWRTNPTEEHCYIVTLLSIVYESDLFGSSSPTLTFSAASN